MGTIFSRILSRETDIDKVLENSERSIEEFDVESISFMYDSDSDSNSGENIANLDRFMYESVSDNFIFESDTESSNNEEVEIINTVQGDICVKGNNIAEAKLIVPENSLFTSFGYLQGIADQFGEIDYYNIVYFESDSELIRMPEEVKEVHFQYYAYIDGGVLYFPSLPVRGQYIICLHDNASITADMRQIDNVLICEPGHSEWSDIL